MKNKARDYKPSTVRRLDILSGNQCAAPGCTRSLIASDDESIISKICHIEAASKNGPRFNPNMTDEERRHFNNLILLCEECHTIIDNKSNETEYPVELLREWKLNHESKKLSALNSNTSLLRTAINQISEANFDDIAGQDVETYDAFNIEDKIKHNAIKRNKALIDDYKVFYSKISALYAELESQGSFKKEKLLRNIKKIYLRTKGKYVADSSEPMKLIRDNADNIIEDIEDSLISSCVTGPGCSEEDISFGITVILIDAFMRCKILEEPPVK